MMGNASRTRRYKAPAHVAVLDLAAELPGWRSLTPEASQRLLVKDEGQPSPVFYAGDRLLLHRPTIAIVGSRQVSPAGLRRASQLARELVALRMVVVSGLAQGVDAAAHRATIEAGGKTIAVLGTPLDQVTPKAHASLQEEICEHHLALSQFKAGSQVYPSNFPQRNKLMAAITDATVIIEASDTSGTLHQAAECQRLGRWLFIARSVMEDSTLTWPRRFKAAYERTRVLDGVDDIVDALGR